MLMTDGGRTEAGLGDMETAELAGDKERRGASLPPMRKLLTLPSKLLHDTRRDALLGGAGGEGTGPSSETRLLLLKVG